MLANHAGHAQSVEAGVRADIANRRPARYDPAQDTLLAVLVNAEPFRRVGGTADPEQAAIDSERNLYARVRRNQIEKSSGEPEKLLGQDGIRFWR